MTIAYRATMHRSAIFSACRTWRYTLSRIWDDSKPLVHWCALNPSVAAESVNDPTIIREITFTQAWGYGGLVKTNLYAYCATDPTALWQTEDPVGPENNRYLSEVAHTPRIGLHLVAWGVERGVVRDRVREVLTIFDGLALVCLGRTKNGSPRHPLFVPQRTAYEAYP